MNRGLPPRILRCRIDVTLFAAVMVAVVLDNSATAEQPPKRAAPPTWSRDVLDAFFEDARAHLSGPRPSPAQVAPPGGRPGIPDAPSQEDKAFAWSRFIDADTLDTEVKRIANALREPMANRSKFKGGGYQQCRQDFSLLAILFAVIAEYDQDVRWQEQAASLRDAYARAGANCKVGTDQSFAEAQARKTDLEDIVRGQPIEDRPAEPLEVWSRLADRPLLMQRMEVALDERIAPALGSASEFKRQADNLRHESQILAALAEIMRRESYEFWDDEGFVEMAQQLKRSADSISHGAAEGNYEEARQALGNVRKSCSNCHDGYRG